MGAQLTRMLTIGLFCIGFSLAAVSPLSAGELEDHKTFDRLGVEEYSTGARAELAGFQTLHGLVLSVQACAFLDCGDAPRLAVALPTLGAGIGLVGSLVATSDRGITPGHATALNSGAVWGGWLSFAGGYMVGDLDSQDTTGLMMLGQLAGVGVGHALAMNLRPTAGDVRLINSAGAWSAFYYLIFTEALLELNQERRTAGLGLIGATTLGAVGAGALASQYPMSRGRVGLISSAGILGGLAGLATPILILGDDASGRQVATGASIGAAAGMVVGTILTEDFDDPEEYPRADMTFSIHPSVDGQGIQAGLSGSF